MPPREDPSQAHRDAALAILVHTLIAQLSRTGDQAERIVRALEAGAAAQAAAAKQANPWAVLASLVALAGRALDRVPQVALGVGFVIGVTVPVLGLTIAAAPMAAPLISELFDLLASVTTLFRE